MTYIADLPIASRRAEDVTEQGRWRLAWRSLLTGYIGYGEPTTKSLADAWLREEQKTERELELRHWIEPVS